jgi:hypothetical protein
MYKTKFHPIVLYLCGKWSLILRQERRLTASENRVLRGIFETKDKVTGRWENCIKRNFITCSPFFTKR